MLTVGVIGAGRFGYNFIKTFKELKVNVAWVCARSDKSILKIKEFGSDIKTTTDYNNLLSDNDVEAVAIVTPAETHYKIAKDTLNAGKNLILEKPVTTSLKECKELVAIAKKKKLKFMAGHVHLFNPGIQQLKKDIVSGGFGKIKSITNIHVGNGPIRQDINALWDFSPHIISILNYLLDKPPKQVFATGVSLYGTKKEDLVNLILRYEGGPYVSSIMSWANPFKMMKLEISGTKKFGIFEDHSVKEKLWYFSKPTHLGSSLSGSRNQTLWDTVGENISISEEKPLTLELKHFVDCILKNKSPVNGGDEMIAITRIIECAQKSLDCGKEVEIK
jgi:predicted dehydrogenase